MDEEPQPVPPKSVIISLGAVQDETELINQSHQGGDSSTEPSESINNYLRIRSQKPDAGLSAFGGVFLLIPFFLLFFSDDVLDMISICCLFFIIGFVLLTINSTQITSWNKQMNNARKQIELTEKIPYPPVAQWPQVAGTVCIIGGFIGADYDGIVFLFGGIIGAGFLLYQFFLVLRQNKAFDQLVNELK